MALTVGTDSYASVADSAAYMTSRLHADAWTNATAADQEKALKMATRAIDRLTLRGSKAESSQSLQFPRCYVNASGASTCEDAVPQVVVDAVCEEALALLDRGNASRYKLQADGVKSFSVGDLSETYRGGRPRLLSVEARDLMRPYAAGAVTIS